MTLSSITRMPNPYPAALRERAVRAYETTTDTYAEVSARFEIGLNTLVRWVTACPRPGQSGALPEERRLAAGTLPSICRCSIGWWRSDPTKPRTN